MSRRLAIALVLGCSASAPAPAPPATRPEPPRPSEPPPLFTIRSDSLGPLTAKTPATLVALRAALRGLDVVPLHDGGLEYRVTHAGARLFDVIPDEAGAILNVHVVSPRIAVAGRSWRVGAPFSGEVTTCECWADQTVCFKDGDHVAVALAKPCREGAAGTRGIAGVAIRAAIWSPRPLAPGGYAPPEED